METSFQYGLLEKVRTIEGVEGVITHCGVDGGGQIYLLSYSTGSGIVTTWHRPKEIIKRVD